MSLARLPVALLLAFSTQACGSTVYRARASETLPAGPARSLCEREAWLVLAPTRARLDGSGQRTREGLGVYRVGATDPEDLPALRTLVGDSAVLQRKADEVREHDTRKNIAFGLGVGGVLLMAIGTSLFVSAFESKEDAAGGEEQHINGSRAAWGSVAVLGGFGLGIAGISVGPSHAQHAKANAARYVFLPEQDPPKVAVDLVLTHDQAVRERCATRPTTP